MKPTEASLKVFSANLVTLINGRGMDHRKLAAELETDPERVYHWVTRTCFPNHRMMVKICNFFEYYDIYKMMTEKI